MAGGTVTHSLDQIGAPVPLGIAPGVRLECGGSKEQCLPQRQRRLGAEGPSHLMRGLRRRHGCAGLQPGKDGIAVLACQQRGVLIRKRGREPSPVARAAAMQCVPEVGRGPCAQAGPDIGGEIAAEHDPEGRFDGAGARQFRPTANRVAGHAISGAREHLAA